MSIDMDKEDVVHIHNVISLLLLRLFSGVRPCAIPEMEAHQAPPSLGFSRQEHWSGLPFPSPMHESEKWKKSLSRVQLFATTWTAAYQASLSIGFSRQEYWSGVPLPSPYINVNQPQVYLCPPPSLGFSKKMCIRWPKHMIPIHMSDSHKSMRIPLTLKWPYQVPYFTKC